MSLLTNVTQHLKRNKVRFEVVSHKTVYTAFDLAQTLKTKLQTVAKTLLIKVHQPKKLSDAPDAHPGSDHFLAVLPGHLRLDLNKVKKLLGAKQVRIASEGEMAKTLKVKPGALTPFGSLHRVRVLMDRALLKTTHALFGAGSFTQSLRLKVKDFHQTEKPLTGDISRKKT